MPERMKTLYSLMICLLTLTLAANAQQADKPKEETKGHVVQDMKTDGGDDNTVVTPYNHDGDVIQASGKAYNGRELTRMARKDINGVAGTVAGVSYTPDRTPSIRGAAPSGTAYFVDGVRSYGALPILMR